jgi:aspartate/methionine/tyrosine aminotransferase
MRTRVVEATQRILVHTDILAQGAAMGALRALSGWMEAFTRHLREMRDRSLERIQRMPGVLCSRPEATPFLFPDVRALGLTSHDLAKHLLERAKVVVQPGAHFGPSGEGFIRINLATSWEILEEAFDRMARALGEL